MTLAAAAAPPARRAIARVPLAVLLATATGLAGCLPGGGPGGERAVPGAACAPPSALSDRDDPVARLFAGADVCVETLRFEDAGVGWTVQVLRGARPGPLWVLPHDDEDAALTTAAVSQARWGGTVVAVETGGQRLNAGIDPNRAFADRPRACPTGGASPRWTRAALGERDGRFPVVALHTNGPRTAARGGSGTISIRDVPEGATAFLPPPGVTPLGDEDDLVIVASRRGTADGRLMETVRALNRAGLNVMVERVEPGGDDCSLSHYAALAGIGPYFNVEVGTGRHALQARMVEIVMEVAGIGPGRVD